MNDVRARMVGAALLLASGGSTLLHRAVFEAARRGPASLAELGLGLLTFALASAGILLLIHGGKVIARRPQRAAPLRQGLDRQRSSEHPAAMHDDDSPDPRQGVALILARRSIAAAAVRRNAAASTLR